MPQNARPDAGRDSGIDAGPDEAGVSDPLHPAAEDVCPGSELRASLAAPSTLRGSTLGLRNDYRSYCGRGDGSGPDGVVAIEAIEAGTLHLTLTAVDEAFDAVLYVQGGCGDASRVFGCSDTGPAAAEALSLPVTVGQRVFAVVDGRNGTAGRFTLEAELRPAMCGDGVINAGEDCDYGDVEAGDGCDAECLFEPQDDGSDMCPGESLTLPPDTTVTLSGHTVGYGDRHTSTCPALGGAPDRVFALSVLASGTLQAALSADFDAMLAVFESCDEVASAMDPTNALDAELLCSDQDLGDNREELRWEAQVSKRYFLLVDGFSAREAGAFELELTLK